MIGTQYSGSQLRRIILLATTMLCGAVSPCVAAQAQSAVQKLAAETAGRITKTRAHHILIAPQAGCLLDMAMCLESSAALRTELERQLPDVQFVSREELVNHVKQHGLLAIDAFDTMILMSLAGEIGAEILAAQDLRWDGNHFQLSNQVYDASTGKSYNRFQTKVSPDISSGDDPLLFADPDSGVFLAIPKRKSSGFRVFRYPNCDRCPPPMYLSSGSPTMHDFVQLRVTITEKGMVDQIAVLGPAANTVTQNAIDAVKQWQFKPAVDSDGKPFGVRTYITFDLSARDIASGIRY